MVSINPIGAVNLALDTLNKLREVAKKIEQAEMRSLLADLTVQMADVKIENAALKEQNASLRSEIAGLKKTMAEPATKEKFTVQYGSYKFEGDANLYCPKCYELQGKKHVTNRASSKLRVCSVCQNPVFA